MAFSIDGAEATGATDKGIWVEADDFDEPVFVPQSQIDDDSEVWKKGDTGTLIVSDWLARERGWA